MAPLILFEWSRREELNTPSAEYASAALALSYTGNYSHFSELRELLHRCYS
jgi:hypothetical protein